jgi:hypothetical protein
VLRDGVTFCFISVTLLLRHLAACELEHPQACSVLQVRLEVSEDLTSTRKAELLLLRRR